LQPSADGAILSHRGWSGIVEWAFLARSRTMARVVAKRVTARIEGDFVVFLIGMRINKPWKLHKWLPVFLAMPKMVRELEARPESGFLGHVMNVGVIVQYWRSFDHPEAYARDQNQLHWPAWIAFNKRVGSSRGDVGIWHETYRVRAGEYECVYSGLPSFGLARASATIEATGQLESARGRIKATSSTVAGQP
jgi:hypothetical protein